MYWPERRVILRRHLCVPKSSGNATSSTPAAKQIRASNDCRKNSAAQVIMFAHAHPEKPTQQESLPPWLAFSSSPELLPEGRVAALCRISQPGREGIAVPVAYRSKRPVPSWLDSSRLRTLARAAHPRSPVTLASASLRANRRESLRSAQSPARHFRPAPRASRHRRCSGLPQLCTDRFPASRVPHRHREETFLRVSRRSASPRPANSSHGCNNRVPTTAAAHLLPGHPRALSRWGIAPGTVRSRESPPPHEFVAA